MSDKNPISRRGGQIIGYLALTGDFVPREELALNTEVPLKGVDGQVASAAKALRSKGSPFSIIKDAASGSYRLVLKNHIAKLKVAPMGCDGPNHFRGQIVLKALLKNSNITQAQLARATEMNNSSIHLIVSGRAAAYPGQVAKICKALGVVRGEIFDEKGWAIKYG